MTAEPELSFEAALKQLEAIVGDLERGAPELSAALAKYEQGVRLLSRCHYLLDKAEQNVALLTGVDVSGSPVTAPLDSAPNSAAEKSGPGDRAGGRSMRLSEADGEDEGISF